MVESPLLMVVGHRLSQYCLGNPVRPAVQGLASSQVRCRHCLCRNGSRTAVVRVPIRSMVALQLACRVYHHSHHFHGPGCWIILQGRCYRHVQHARGVAILRGHRHWWYETSQEFGIICIFGLLTSFRRVPCGQCRMRRVYERSEERHSSQMVHLVHQHYDQRRIRIWCISTL